MTDESERPTHLDLFSGIGGFALAARWAGFRTIAFVEIDKYCQQVIAKNFGAEIVGDSECSKRRTDPKRRTHIGEGKYGQGQTASGIGKSSEDVADSARNNVSEQETGGTERERIRAGRQSIVSGNIFDFDGRPYRGVSLLTGGFPCQPFSVAGKRLGASDDRALWPQMCRVIDEARPAWILGENVPGIIPMELDNVLSDLERIGYACRTFTIPACAVDARHRRDRVWIVGRRETESRLANSECQSTGRRSNGTERRQRVKGKATQNCRERTTVTHVRWLAEPDVGRVAHGIPSRVDRLRGLGNAIVPQVAFEILQGIRSMI